MSSPIAVPVDPAARQTRRVGLALMIALLALVAGSKAILYDTLDPDCFWHLRVAEQLGRDGIGPIVDQISFASIKTPWTPYSWLAELGMKWLWDTFGWRAAVAVQALMMAGIVILVAMACRQTEFAAEPGSPARPGPDDASQSPNSMHTLVATVFACYWMLPYLSFRPVTASILLIALCVWLILRDRKLEERSAAVWWIVPVTLLNANVHFFAMLVPVMVAAMLVGSVLERSFISARRYALLLMFTLTASLATPMLPGMIRSIFHYQQNDPTLAAGFIREFQPFYAGPMWPVSVAFLAGAIGCIALNRGRIRVGEQLWVLVGIILLLRLGRFAPIFALLTAPALAATLPLLRGRALESPRVRAAVAVLLLIGCLRLFYAFPGAATPLDAWLNRHGPDTPGYPTVAADFVASHLRPSHGRLLNEFAWGGYLAWRLGDRFQIWMDGRTQLYTPDFWRAMYGHHRVDAANIPPGADAAIVPLHGSRLKPALLELRWHVIHRDDRAEVLAPAPFIADTAAPE